MVNAAKRMRALSEKLYHVSCGAGSIDLSANAGAQLKRIYMRVPTGEYPHKEFFWGARDFWRGELRRLKYYNPALQTDVETIRNGEGEPMYLTVEYESSDKKALEDLKVKPFPKPQLKIRTIASTKQEAEAQLKDLKNEENLRAICSKLGIRHPVLARKRTPSPKDLHPIMMTPEVASHAPKDEITVKPQPAASASKPQTTSPPEHIYTRTVTLPLAGLRHHEIWNWIRQHTGLKNHGNRPDQHAMTFPHQQLMKFKEQAQKDRRLVRRGWAKKKKEESELASARAAAERASQSIA